MLRGRPTAAELAAVTAVLLALRNTAAQARQAPAPTAYAEWSVKRGRAATAWSARHRRGPQ